MSFWELRKPEQIQMTFLRLASYRNNNIEVIFKIGILKIVLAKTDRFEDP